MTDVVAIHLEKFLMNESILGVHECVHHRTEEHAYPQLLLQKWVGCGKIAKSAVEILTGSKRRRNRGGSLTSVSTTSHETPSGCASETDFDGRSFLILLLLYGFEAKI
ncbi:hypothetical protein M9H77_26742 [Catharanthus roseus]|uniref:Uncharacterized protein n=1 Tax=Catharanthus roseus TaxID=4058 RepID=A0ACC0ABE6_CATRO|nr:hypothetical protein M9H77_26742 [Catharanthus roseus]